MFEKSLSPISTTVQPSLGWQIIVPPHLGVKKSKILIYQMNRVSNVKENQFLTGKIVYIIWMAFSKSCFVFYKEDQTSVNVKMLIFFQHHVNTILALIH